MPCLRMDTFDLFISVKEDNPELSAIINLAVEATSDATRNFDYCSHKGLYPSQGDPAKILTKFVLVTLKACVLNPKLEALLNLVKNSAYYEVVQIGQNGEVVSFRDTITAKDAGLRQIGSKVVLSLHYIG